MDDIQIIVPPRRINFEKHVDGKPVENWKSRCNFDCLYYCWKMNLPKDLVWLTAYSASTAVLMNDCTDMVDKGENTIFKVLYARSLKVRRCADLTLLNMLTQEGNLHNLGTVPSLRDASNMAVCDESEVCVT